MSDDDLGDLLRENARLRAALAEAERRIAEQGERIAELYRAQKNGGGKAAGAGKP